MLLAVESSHAATAVRHMHGLFTLHLLVNTSQLLRLTQQVVAQPANSLSPTHLWQPHAWPGSHLGLAPMQPTSNAIPCHDA